MRFAKWSRTLLSIEDVTCEGPQQSKDQQEHHLSHTVGSLCVTGDRTSGTNVICSHLSKHGNCQASLTGCAQIFMSVTTANRQEETDYPALKQLRHTIITHCDMKPIVAITDEDVEVEVNVDNLSKKKKSMHKISESSMEVEVTNTTIDTLGALSITDSAMKKVGIEMLLWSHDSILSQADRNRKPLPLVETMSQTAQVSHEKKAIIHFCADIIHSIDDTHDKRLYTTNGSHQMTSLGE